MVTRGDAIRNRSVVFSPAYRPQVVGQEHALVEGRLCLYPYDALGHAYELFSKVKQVGGLSTVPNVPLEIIWSRITVLLIRTKRTNIAR
jgi:hypothetical protein